MTDRILLIEDDEKLGAQIVEHLRQAGYGPFWWRTGRPLTADDAAQIGLLILDLMLPGTAGLDILKALREVSDVPVLILSARNDTLDKVRALKLGADDYMTKPFWPEELLARVRARLRRPTMQHDGRLEVGPVAVDLATRAAHVAGDPVNLTRVELESPRRPPPPPRRGHHPPVARRPRPRPRAGGHRAHPRRPRLPPAQEARRRRRLGGDGVGHRLPDARLGGAVKLRLRLAITVLGVALPVIVAIAWLHRRAEETAMREGLTQLAVAAMESGQRARCEASPATWHLGPRRLFGAGRGPGPGLLGGLPPGGPPPGGPPPGGPPPGGPPPGSRRPGRFFGRHPRPARPRVPFRPRLFAYSASLTSENPRAPKPAPALVAALAAGEPTAAGWTRIRGHPVYEVLVPMSWRTGPCAVILAAAPRPRRARPLLPPLAVWGLPTLAVLLAVLLAVGPVVRRIRRLTHAVKGSADAGWDGTIPVHGRDELGELARAFEAAGREIRARMATQAKREQTLRDFLANTTHDVMIPLTVLEGHLDAL